jgi:hypothetical protein
VWLTVHKYEYIVWTHKVFCFAEWETASFLSHVLLLINLPLSLQICVFFLNVSRYAASNFLYKWIIYHKQNMQVNDANHCELENVSSNFPLLKSLYHIYNKQKGLLPLCLDVCVCNCESLKIPSPQMLQINGFLSECVNIWLFKLPCVMRTTDICEVFHQYESSYRF